MQYGQKKNLFNFFNLKNKNSHDFRVRSKRQINESEGKEEEGEQRRNSEKLRFQRSGVQMWWPDPYHSHECGYLSREPSHCITPRTTDHIEFSEAVQYDGPGGWRRQSEGHWRWRDQGSEARALNGPCTERETRMQKRCDLDPKQAWPQIQFHQLLILCPCSKSLNSSGFLMPHI